MVELRAVINLLRDELGVPYPLAHAKPFIGSGLKLLQRVQDEAELPGEYCLVAIAGGQQTLTPASEAFYERVQWEDDVASAWRPADDPKSPVRMRPNHRFGLPSVGGVKTEIVWERIEADESFDEIAGELELSVDEVLWALAYETSLRAPREAG